MDSIVEYFGQSPRQLLRANAIRLIVRDMGNGVDRVDGTEFIPVGEAIAGASHPESVALGFPMPARIVDLLECGAAGLGLIGADLARLLPAGFARSLPGERIELTSWMAMLV